MVQVAIYFDGSINLVPTILSLPPQLERGPWERGCGLVSFDIYILLRFLCDRCDRRKINSYNSKTRSFSNNLNIVLFILVQQIHTAFNFKQSFTPSYYVNPKTTNSDQHLNSPVNINTLSSSQVTRIKNFINQRILS